MNALFVVFRALALRLLHPGRYFFNMACFSKSHEKQLSAMDWLLTSFRRRPNAEIAYYIGLLSNDWDTFPAFYNWKRAEEMFHYAAMTKHPGSLLQLHLSSLLRNRSVLSIEDLREALLSGFRADNVQDMAGITRAGYYLACEDHPEAVALEAVALGLELLGLAAEHGFPEAMYRFGTFLAATPETRERGIALLTQAKEAGVKAAEGTLQKALAKKPGKEPPP